MSFVKDLEINVDVPVSVAPAHAITNESADKLCVTFMCDERYFDKFLHTCGALLTVGDYGNRPNENICLLICEKLHALDIYNHPFILENRIEVKYFPEISFPDEFHAVARRRDRYDKLIQYHKFYLFDPFFKKWDFVFYLDCGITIYKPIKPLFDCRERGRLLAHSDAYHTYEWDLFRQFQDIDDFLPRMLDKYKLDIDYFQTTILLYDTAIIDAGDDAGRKNTFSELYRLAVEYPNCWTNEQGIMSLYFICEKEQWTPIPLGDARDKKTRYYDYLRRWGECEYIMTKM